MTTMEATFSTGCVFVKNPLLSGWEGRAISLGSRVVNKFLQIVDLGFLPGPSVLLHHQPVLEGELGQDRGQAGGQDHQLGEDRGQDHQLGEDRGQGHQLGEDRGQEDC